MRRLYELPTASQLFVYTALTEYLGAELAPESPRDVAIRKRGRALEALARVGANHELAEGVAPTTTQVKSSPAVLSRARDKTVREPQNGRASEPVTGL